MRYRPLGQTGLQVSEIGFGAWGIGGAVPGILSYGPTEDHISLQALETAFEQGVTFYDTAPLYGNGHSETLLGRAFGHRREAVILASKTSYDLDPTGDASTFMAGLKESLQHSLKRLQTDYLDLLQLHDTPISELIAHPEILASLKALKKQGWVRAIGFSLKSPAEGLPLFESEMWPDAIQVNYNLTDQRAHELGLLPLCERHHVGVIIRTPLCFGFLTDQYQQCEFAPTDHRSHWSVEQRARWQHAYDEFRTVLVAEQGATPAQQALRFCLSAPGVSTVIPGMLNAEQVLENTAAGTLPLFSETIHRRLFEVYAKNQFFVKAS